jgi:hypothetical protein
VFQHPAERRDRGLVAPHHVLRIGEVVLAAAVGGAGRGAPAVGHVQDAVGGFGTTAQAVEAVQGSAVRRCSQRLQPGGGGIRARQAGDGEADLRAELVKAVADAPDGLQSLDVLLRAFRKAGRVLEENRSFSEPRLEVIAATPVLRERELAKAESLASAIADALRQRGVPSRLAGLAAQAGWATFHQAVQAWIDDPSQRLNAHLDLAFDDLRALSATAPPAKAAPGG